jgi:hypothetical protein
MTAVSVPVNRPAGRALLIASAACQPKSAGQLQQLGYECAPTTDPYAAMLEICQRPLVYRAIVISLQSVYREELSLIWTAKQRYPHLEVFLTQTDGRQAALAEAMRFGADGLLADDGLHRLNEVSPRSTEPLPPIKTMESMFEPLPVAAESIVSDEDNSMSVDQTNPNEPILTADELRALLEEPTLPSGGND